MTQSNFEKNGGTYTQVGDYLIPDLTLPPEEQNIHIGVWGAGLRWRPLPKAEAPTEPAGETGGINATLWKISRLHSTLCR